MKVLYQAIDGTLFPDQQACVGYEKILYIAGKLSKRISSKPMQDDIKQTIVDFIINNRIDISSIDVNDIK